MTEEQKQRLREAGREDLIEIYEINQSGYAGILPNGNIVDRRQHPEAIPVQKNTMMGIPEPKPLDAAGEQYRERMTEFDKIRFSHGIQRRMIAKELSIRQAAAQIGISASTLHRLINAAFLPEVYTYFLVCKWMGYSMEFFFNDKTRQEAIPVNNEETTQSHTGI